MTEYVRMRSRPGEPGAVVPRRQAGGSEGEATAALLFAFLVFFLVAFLSLWQLTQESRALTLVEAGIVSATDIDRLIEDDFADLQLVAENSDEEILTIPGFPVDIVVTVEEITESTPEEFREILLDRSSQSVYDNGAEAFDISGNQDIGRFSAEGGLQFALNGLTGNWHGLSQWAAIILAFAAAAAALYVLRREDGHRRFVLLGTFTAGAGVIGCLAVFAVRWFVGGFGGDDPFSADLREIANAALSVPMTNFVVITGAGLAVTMVGLGLKLAHQRFPEHRDLAPGHYEYDDDWEYDEPDFGHDHDPALRRSID